MDHANTPSTFWTERLVPAAAGFFRQVMTSPEATTVEVLPFFQAEGGKYAGNLPLVNWGTPDLHTAAIEPRWISLDTASLKRTSLPHPVIPASSSNPLYEFELAGEHYIVDGISILQRMVASREQLFAALLSPFRELAVRGRLVDGIANIVVNTEALHRMGYLKRGDLISDVDASCLAFWLCDDRRLADLDRCAASMQAGGELWLPKTPVRLYCQVRGVCTRDKVFVQSLAHGVSTASHRDLLWRDGWTATRVTRPGGLSGVEIKDRSAAYWHRRLFLDETRHMCPRRPLAREEAQMVRHLAGWKRLSSS